MEIGKIKICAACSCLAVVIITASGPICKRCLAELYKYPDLPTSSYFSENLEFGSGIIYNASRSAIGNTTTGTIYFDNK